MSNVVISSYPLVKKLTDWLQGAGVEIDNVSRIVIDIPFGGIPTIAISHYANERWLETKLEGLKADEIKQVEVVNDATTKPEAG